MGLYIPAIGKGTPGVNGIPGDTFTNKQLLNRLTRGLSFWQRAGLFVKPSLYSKAERGLEILEKKTGVKERQMFISDTLCPNECLATAAALDAIKKMQEVKPAFSLNDIDGFIMVGDTSDTIFPIGGKVVVKALGIKPKHFANASLACSSILNALQQACAWMEFDDSCKYVLIAASDITSRLHQHTAKKQPFLFGDQAVAMIIEKNNGLGGFTLSNLYLDPDAPDIIHLPLHTDDSMEIRKAFSDSDFGNDYNLKLFGDYEAKSTAGLYRLYLQTQEGKEGKDGACNDGSNNGSGALASQNEMFIPPQAPRNVLFEAANKAEVDCKNYEGHVADSTIPNHAITGAAGTPLAMYYMNSHHPLSQTRFTAFISAIGGLSAILTYNPTAKRILNYGYDIDDRIINSSGTSGGSDEGKIVLPDMHVTVTNNGHGKLTNGTLTNGKPIPTTLTINNLANEVNRVLQRHETVSV